MWQRMRPLLRVAQCMAQRVTPAARSPIAALVAMEYFG